MKYRAVVEFEIFQHGRPDIASAAGSLEHTIVIGQDHYTWTREGVFAIHSECVIKCEALPEKDT